MTTDRVGGGPCRGDGVSLAAADGLSATPPGRAVAFNDHRFGFWGRRRRRRRIRAGLADRRRLLGSGCRLRGSGRRGGGRSRAELPAEESPVSNVDVCAPPVLSTFISPTESVEFFDSVDENLPTSRDSVNDESPFESLDRGGPRPRRRRAGCRCPRRTRRRRRPDVDPDDESGDEFAVESGSAHATPGVFATAAPIPSATASAPTRPIYLA